MLIKNFEESTTWQKAQDLAMEIYKILKTCKDYSFKDQMQRAAVSVSNNIAEGFERQTNKELAHFLYIAKGSCGEVRSMNHLGKKLGLISTQDFNTTHNLCIQVSQLLSGFIKSCK